MSFSEALVVFCVQLYEDSGGNLHVCCSARSAALSDMKRRGKCVFKDAGGNAAALKTGVVFCSPKRSKCSLGLSVNLQMLLMQNVADGPPDSEAAVCIVPLTCLFRPHFTGIILKRDIIAPPTTRINCEASEAARLHIRDALCQSRLFSFICGGVKTSNSVSVCAPPIGQEEIW